MSLESIATQVVDRYFNPLIGEDVRKNEGEITQWTGIAMVVAGIAIFIIGTAGGIGGVIAGLLVGGVLCVAGYDTLRIGLNIQRIAPLDQGFTQGIDVVADIVSGFGFGEGTLLANLNRAQKWEILTQYTLATGFFGRELLGFSKLD